MSQRFEAWEILWTQREYGGPSRPAGATLHLTREDALAYKARREGDRSVWPPKDPFYEDGSEPKRKLVSKTDFERVEADGLR